MQFLPSTLVFPPALEPSQELEKECNYFLEHSSYNYGSNFLSPHNVQGFQAVS